MSIQGQDKRPIAAAAAAASVLFWCAFLLAASTTVKVEAQSVGGDPVVVGGGVGGGGAGAGAGARARARRAGAIANATGAEFVVELGTLTDGDGPIRGSVQAAEVDLFILSLNKKNDSWPDVLITLTVTSFEGDADLFCVPSFLFDSGLTPSKEVASWSSAHSQGKDYVFISHKHKMYDSAKVGVDNAGQYSEAVVFVCAVAGFSLSGTNYEVEVDVDYDSRELVEEERNALESVFTKCCTGPADCLPWKEKFQETGETFLDFCHSEGSVCDSSGHLIRLDMSHSQLSCKFPVPSFQILHHLQKLELQFNNLKGDIAEILEGLSNLSNLQHLDLSENLLTGMIFNDEEPDIRSPLCKLAKQSLQFLRLDTNSVKGNLPGCLFGNDSDIREVHMDNTNLEGVLPEFSKDSMIEVISLSEAGLSGSIPRSLGMLKHLKNLDLSQNSFTGTIPPELGSSPALISIQLSDNQLEGPLPAAFATSASLRSIRVEFNSLSKLPDEWYMNTSASDHLIIFDASHNNIKGEFPLGLSTARSLAILILQSNEFSGQLPSKEGIMPKVAVLLLGDNQFEGEIPEEFKHIGMFKQVQSPFPPQLDLSNNLLNGTIPEFLFATNVPEQLESNIQLGGNTFSCPIPQEAAYIQDLTCTGVRVPTNHRGVTNDDDDDDDGFFISQPDSIESVISDSSKNHSVDSEGTAQEDIVEQLLGANATSESQSNTQTESASMDVESPSAAANTKEDNQNTNATANEKEQVEQEDDKSSALDLQTGSILSTEEQTRPSNVIDLTDEGDKQLVTDNEDDGLSDSSDNTKKVVIATTIAIIGGVTLISGVAAFAIGYFTFKKRKANWDSDEDKFNLNCAPSDVEEGKPQSSAQL